MALSAYATAGWCRCLVPYFAVIMCKKLHFIPVLLLLLTALVAFSACKKHVVKPVKNSDVEKVKQVLTGEIVLSTRAKIGEEDRTLLPTGCPIKYEFKWNNDDTMTVVLKEFSVGNMPFVIYFSCRSKILTLNSFEKQDAKFQGEGWVKFSGENGKIVAAEKGKIAAAEKDLATKKEEKSGASILGYFNTNTQEIEFSINYNMMNVTSQCFRQKIDKTRIDRYEEEFAQYEKDLAAEKKKRGIN